MNGDIGGGNRNMSSEATITEAELVAELNRVKGSIVNSRYCQFKPAHDRAILAREKTGLQWQAFGKWFKEKYGFASEMSLRRRAKVLLGGGK